jgi:prepilin peptidase CpaA
VVIVVAASLVAAATDVWKYKVYNLLTLPLLGSGLCYHTYVYGLPGLGGSALGVVFGFGVLFTLYVLGGMGAGDVKLMAGVGAWLGVKLTFYVFLASSLAAGVYALVLIVLYDRTSETWTNLKIAWHRFAALGRLLGLEERVEAEVARPDRRGRIIPFAAMIAFGVLATLVWVYWQGGTP